MLIPYFIWSFVYLAKDCILNGRPSVKHIVYALCVGKVAAPFYYIVVLVQLVLMTPWLIKKKGKKWLYIITPVYLILLYIVNIFTGKMPRMYETLFPAWLMFYFMGIVCRCGKWNKMFAGIKRWQVIAIGGAVLGISVAEAAVLLKIGCDIGFAASQIKFSSFSYAFVIVLMLAGTADRVMKEGRWAEMLVSVGDCAYGIFYIHVLVLQIAQKVIRMINLTCCAS